MTVLRTVTHLLPVSPVFLKTELDRVQVALVHAALAVPHRVPQSPILGSPKSRSSSLRSMFPVMGALYQPIGVAAACERRVRSEVEACVADLRLDRKACLSTSPSERSHTWAGSSSEAWPSHFWLPFRGPETQAANKG